MPSIYDLEYLKIVAHDFRSGVEVKDRKYQLKTYKDCFVGSEAVKFLIESGHASSFKEAEVIANTLMSDLGMFERVTSDHELEDKQIFYRFIDN